MSDLSSFKMDLFHVKLISGVLIDICFSIFNAVEDIQKVNALFVTRRPTLCILIDQRLLILKQKSNLKKLEFVCVCVCLC